MIELFNIQMTPQEQTSTNPRIDDYPSSATISPRYINLISERVPSQGVFTNIYDTLGTADEGQLVERFRKQLVERFIADIKSKVWDFPFDVEFFLRDNDNLIPHLNDVLMLVGDQVSNVEKVFSGVVLQKWSDPEIPGMESIEVIVRIAFSNSTMLFSLWKRINEELSRQIPSEVLEKLTISVEGL